MTEVSHALNPRFSHILLKYFVNIRINSFSSPLVSPLSITSFFFGNLMPFTALYSFLIRTAFQTVTMADCEVLSSLSKLLTFKLQLSVSLHLVLPTHSYSPSRYILTVYGNYASLLSGSAHYFMSIQR